MPLGLILLIPPIIVVIGSLWKKPTIPVMMISSGVAVVIGIVVQGFSFEATTNSWLILNKSPGHSYLEIEHSYLQIDALSDPIRIFNHNVPETITPSL